MADKMNITDALKQLDPKNDDHWTSDKKPAVAAVQELVGSDTTVSRADIEGAADGFTRDTAPGFFMTVGGGEAPSKPWEQPSDAATASEANDSPRAEGASDGSADSEGGEGGPADGDGETEQPEVDLASAGPDEIEALEEELRAREETIADIRMNLDIGNKMLADHEADADKVRNRIEALRPKNAPALTVKAYLESQKRIGQQRGQNALTLKEAGLDLKALSRAVGKAPIDQAFARKTGRGGQRPQRK